MNATNEVIILRVIAASGNRTLSTILQDALNKKNMIKTRGANWIPKFRNSEIVRIPIRYSEGRQLILSDNFGQAPLLNNFSEKLVVCTSICFLVLM